MIYLNGSPINTTLFSDNTSQVWKLSENLLKTTNYAHITWEFQSEGEFLQLAQLKTLLDSYEFTATLKLKYLPYGRQDKEVSNDATFALVTFSKLLNSLNFEKVLIIDPHSSRALELIDHSEPIFPVDRVKQLMEMTKSDLLCYPDDGAVKKYAPIFVINFVYGKKVREQSTGKILSYNLVGNVKDKNILIVDDICDGGMTFKLLTKELLDGGAKEVNLFVSHGIFSQGVRTLFESGIKQVFTTDGDVSELGNRTIYRTI